MFLGFDFSTQQIKAVLVSEDLKTTVGTWSVSFDGDLPEYKTKNGSHQSDDGLTVTSPTLLWVEALDLLLQRMKDSGAQLNKVVSVSGAGQQHGSVYWAKGAREILRCLSSDRTLKDQLKDAFSVEHSPIWMDSSTDAQLKVLELALGGPMALAEITGSRGYHRFTGPQIMKQFQNNPSAFHRTERISLVSSFAASLLLGDYAPIDWSDGSGMNLLDIRSHAWHKPCLQACGENLSDRLGPPESPKTILGKISSYYVENYGFNPECQICIFTGDNPSSLAGMNQRQGDIAISLGTSDTVFLSITDPKPQLNVHVLCNPVDPGSYMAMLCFKNGALVRENTRKRCGCKDWNEFSELFKSTKPGNCGKMGFYFDFPEILPQVTAGAYRFTVNGDQVEHFSLAEEARAMIESQCLAKKLHALSMGIPDCNRVLVTGGASVNPDIVQVLADVFDCPVYTQQVQDSAALGGAYRAKYCLTGSQSFADVCDVTNFQVIARPDTTSVQTYKTMMQDYAKCEAQLLKTRGH